jgi:hypothetical protein
MDDWKKRRNRKNLALALTLVALAVIFYTITLVKTRELEDRRHQKDAQAHAVTPFKTTL